jgi:outer membrane protein OmpA-like peptidoglycan-associated protein
MTGQRAITRRPKDEAEKPFWISFADLMSALMVLFLVVMSVALLSVTVPAGAEQVQKEAHDADVNGLLDSLAEAAQRFPGISVSKLRAVIDFGDRARFAFSEATLTSQQQRALRDFVPEILTIAGDARGKRVLKRVVVEGFTDTAGSYLSNLGLSLRRSERVLCSLFEAPMTDEPPLSMSQLTQIRDLFMVGGYSFNSAKGTPEESRRVEMRLEFLGLGESRQSSAAAGVFGRCT